VQNYDLVKKYPVYVVGEIYLKINFHLISFPGNRVKNIKKVYSHPVALGQVKSFLKSNPHITPVEFNDTAGAVKMIKDSFINAEDKMQYGAIASRLSAEVYDMELIVENIHENTKNYTRFLAISRSSKRVTELNTEECDANTNKVMLAFEVSQESGILYNCLQAFGSRHIKIIKIENRPIINTHWHHTYFVDLECDINSEELQQALLDLGKFTPNYRVLGCFCQGGHIDT